MATNANRNRLLLMGLSLIMGLVISFFLLFLGLSGREMVWSVQMLGFWVGAALGFGVHGALYLVGALVNALFYGAFCFFVFWLVRKALGNRDPRAQRGQRQA